MNVGEYRGPHGWDSSLTRQARSTPAASGAPTLLVADENPVLLQALTDLLQGKGFHVVASTTTGSAAVQLARQLRPDLVVIDVKMPGLDGIEASRLIREASPTSQVVIYSANDDPGLRTRAIEAGVAECVMKGRPPALLLEALRRALERGGRSRSA